MPVHKVIIGEGGEKYLPFALSRLRHFAIIRSGTTAQKYTFEGGAVTVRVEYNPEHGNHFVRIDASSGVQGYEFVSTGYEAIDPDGLPFTEKFVTTVDAAKRKTKGLWSNWGRGVDGQTKSHVPLAINRQANSQYFWWPIEAAGDVAAQVRTKNYFMTSTFGRAMGAIQFYDDQSFFTPDFNSSLKGGQIAYEHDGEGTDLFNDVLFAKHQDGLSSVAAVPAPVEPNWWRRGCMTEREGRQFVIMTDMQSNIRVVPASYLTDPTACMFPADKGKIVLAEVMLPAGAAIPSMATMVRPTRLIGEVEVSPGVVNDNWVFIDDSPQGNQIWEDEAHPVPDTGIPSVPGFSRDHQFQKHDYVWAFNSTGTRMVSIIDIDANNNHADLTILDVTVENKQIGTTPSSTPLRRIAQCGANVHVPAETQAVFSEKLAEWGGVSGAKIYKRALVELAIEITITGTGEDDFEVSTAIMRFTGPRWFTNADYAFRDARLQAKGVELDDLITSELVLYTDRDPPFDAKTYSMSYTGSPLSITEARSERAQYAFRVIQNQRSSETLYRFCVMKNMAMAFHGEYVKAPLQITDQFPGYESLMYGPFGTLQEWYPPLPTKPPYVFWRYRRIRSQFGGEPDPEWTSLDVEDLRSLSWVFAGRYLGNVNDELGAYRIVFGEEVQGDANVKGLVSTPVSEAEVDNELLPADFTEPMKIRMHFGALFSLPETDISTAFSLGLHREVQKLTRHLAQSLTTEAGKYASHPDGHFAHVTVQSVRSGQTRMFDDIRYRKVLPNGDGEEQVTLSHMSAFRKAWGEKYTPAEFTTNLYDNIADDAARMPVLLRLGIWWNIRLKPGKSVLNVSLNPRFEETP